MNDATVPHPPAKGSTAIPAWVICNSRISRNAIMVFLSLAAHANEHGSLLDMKRINHEARCSNLNAEKALSELHEANLISIADNNRVLVNMYNGQPK
jgi:hypothetical protein